MTKSFEEIYDVVVNLEDQYSIWPSNKKLPFGWKAVGKCGLKDECLAYIKEVWVDMRPKSLKDTLPSLFSNFKVVSYDQIFVFHS